MSASFPLSHFSCDDILLKRDSEGRSVVLFLIRSSAELLENDLICVAYYNGPFTRLGDELVKLYYNIETGELLDIVIKLTDFAIKYPRGFRSDFDNFIKALEREGAPEDDIRRIKDSLKSQVSKIFNEIMGGAGDELD